MKAPLYGLMAEFKEPEKVLLAIKSAKEAGFNVIDAYSPFPIEGMDELINKKNNQIGWIAFFFGIFGIIAGIALQYYVGAVVYPINVGGRPLVSWATFVPICFELMVLFSCLGIVFSMFLLNRLPEPYHPVFNVPEFSLIAKDRFFIVIEKKDPLFDIHTTRTFLESLSAEKVFEVCQ